MRRAIIAFGVAACVTMGNAQAADKAEVLSRIDSARIGIEAFVAKTKNNEAVVADVEAARGFIRRAAVAFESGKQMFGFGGISPEADQEITHCIAMAELNVALAESRLAKKRNGEELATITEQLNRVKARVQRFEARKAEVEKLRSEAAKVDALVKEVAQLKADKALLASQVEMLMAVRKELEKLKAEKSEVARKPDEADAAAKKPAERVETAVSEHYMPAVHTQPAAAEGVPVRKGKAVKAPDNAEMPLSELISVEKIEPPDTPKVDSVTQEAL